MSNNVCAQKAALSGPSLAQNTPATNDADKQAAFVRIARLIRIWQSLPGPKRRRDLDPLTIGADLLPHLCLGHFLGNGTDLRYDLIGAEIANLAPRLAPGSLASDTLRIQHTDRDHVLALFLDAGASQRPKIHEVRYNSVENVPLKVFAAMLPLGLGPNRNCAEDLLLAVWRTSVTDVIEKDCSTDLTEEFLQFSGIEV